MERCHDSSPHRNDKEFPSFSACVCSFPCPTSSAPTVRSVWLAVHTFQKSKTFYNIPKSFSFPVLFSSTYSLSSPFLFLQLSLWLTGPPRCSGQHPDWQGVFRKGGCDWLVWNSAAPIRSFNTSRCLSSSRQAELWASITLLYTRRGEKKRSCALLFYSTAESSGWCKDWCLLVENIKGKLTYKLRWGQCFQTINECFFLGGGEFH